MYSYNELEQQAVEVAKEDGIYYEWQSGSVTDNEYEQFIEDTILKLMAKYKTKDCTT